jgi:hydroxypyruvate reductase
MAVVRAAIAAADAGRLVTAALATDAVREPIRAARAIDVIAAGKTATPMLRAFADAASIAPRRTSLRFGSHPLPDETSITAAMEALDIASTARDDDLVVVLLSGGASSMMALPAEGVGLDAKQKTTRRLLAAGAEIHELNAIRKHLSGIKGGQLAAAARCPVLTLAISDVVDDDLSAIGSGPTVADATTFEMARALIQKYGGATQFPVEILRRLDAGAAGSLPETPKPGDPRLARSRAHLLGGRTTAMEGARQAAESLGYRVCVVDNPVTGEARVAAKRLIDLASDWAATRAVPAGGKTCIVTSGETTVRVAGAGKGGRNQECALAMSLGLDSGNHESRFREANVVAASVGTDGVDGPTDAAGAIVDSRTVSRAAEAGLRPVADYLNDNNSYTFFDQLGDLIRTGPTTTNVGDIQVILID